MPPGSWFATVARPFTGRKSSSTGARAGGRAGAALRLEVLEERATPAFLEFIDPHPAPGNQFGATVLPLSTGNVVITSPLDDAGGTDAGAVYLFNGTTGALISALTGSSPNDQIGAVRLTGGPAGGVAAVGNGNFVVYSGSWDNGAATDAGAVTFGNGVTGVSGVVSPANSLVGTTAGDQVGNVTVLSNGNYVVQTSAWHNGAVANAGAVTFGSGATGVVGAVSAANSLVGTTASDSAGARLVPLANGNYVVASSNWDNGAVANAGAVTFGSGTAGVAGAIGAANSLVGTTASDQIGGTGVTALGNGNYVVRSSSWDNGAVANTGAVTFGNGTTGVAGAVSAANSLIGSAANDQVGSGDFVALSNGNFVVTSPNWDNGAATDAGAVTWESGAAGATGAVSAANSLVGSTSSDLVGIPTNSVTALANGNYVVKSTLWHNGAAASAGAVTFGNGTTGVTGVVSAANSLVGTTASDMVGTAVVPLANGNYVVRSPSWHNGAVAGAGAVTFGNGTSGVTGAVSAANSLVGTTANDQVGGNVTTLSTGSFVVVSPNWDNGAVVNAGAVTFGSGTSGVTGAVSAANSLVGSTANDQVGNFGVVGLANGNYVARSTLWDNGATANVGAVTLGSGTTGVVGPVSAANSLIGTSANDQIGGTIAALPNGNFVIASSTWDNGAAADAGAVTFVNGAAGLTGPVTAANSLVGTTAGDAVGGLGIAVLGNGNYLVRSNNWNNGAATRAGAVTFGSGASGVTGAVSAANSLVGTTANDSVGNQPPVELASGNYVVLASGWDNGAVVNAGAVTFGSGTTGVAGAISAANSLVGTKASDQVGAQGVVKTSDGNYLVPTPTWDNGAVADAGAVTWGSGTTGASGPITAANSLIGLAATTSLQPVVLDGVNAAFYARFVTEGGGKVRVGSTATGAPAPTATTLSLSAAVVATDQAVTLTAFARVPAGGTPTGTVTFLDNGVALPGGTVALGGGTATFTTSALAAGTHTITAVYNGNSGYFASTSPPATLTVDTPPTITSDGGGATAAVSVPENTTAVTTVTAADPDPGTTLTFSISGGADAAQFAIDAATGALTFLAPPDFESPGSAAGTNVYLVTVQVFDGLLVTTQDITATVTGVVGG